LRPEHSLRSRRSEAAEGLSLFGNALLAGAFVCRYDAAAFRLERSRRQNWLPVGVPPFPILTDDATPEPIISRSAVKRGRSPLIKLGGQCTLLSRLPSSATKAGKRRMQWTTGLTRLLLSLRFEDAFIKMEDEKVADNAGRKLFWLFLRNDLTLWRERILRFGRMVSSRSMLTPDSCGTSWTA
jgi:hypothetical protein